MTTHPAAFATDSPPSLREFVHRTAARRVVFGFGTRRGIAAEARRADITRAMVVSTPEQAATAEEIAHLLGDRGRVRFPRARMHTPTSVTDEAVAIAARDDVDGIVAVGGGSAIGLSKALALRRDLPQIALPTTYAGSEMTDILGQTADGSKQTMRDPRIEVETVVYDVELTLTLPAITSVTSGLNAMAHAIEGLYADDTNPLIALMAEGGIRALGSALPRLARTAGDATARTDALYGAWLCGSVLGATSMALHHKLCHVLGGAFDLPHAETHAVLLPYTIAYNAPAVPTAIACAARALNTPDVPSALFALLRDSPAPVSLRELGMPGDSLERAADLALSNPYRNPRPLTRAGIRALLDDAWHGRPPRSSAS